MRHVTHITVTCHTCECDTYEGACEVENDTVSLSKMTCHTYDDVSHMNATWHTYHHVTHQFVMETEPVEWLYSHTQTYTHTHTHIPT